MLMRKILLIIILNLLVFNSSIAQNISINEIKEVLVDFLISNEQIPNSYEPDDLCDCLIIEMKSGKQINEEQIGVFLFSTLSSHEYLHILLLDFDSYEIVNMRDSFDVNMKKVLTFFKANADYTRSDIIYYLEEMAKIYDKNTIINNHLVKPRI